MALSDFDALEDCGSFVLVGGIEFGGLWGLGVVVKRIGSAVGCVETSGEQLIEDGGQFGVLVDVGAFDLRDLLKAQWLDGGDIEEVGW